MSVEPLSVPIAEPSGVLLRLMSRLFRNGLHLTVRHSSLRMLMILGLSSVIWSFVFLVSYHGFGFLQTQWPLSGDMLGSLFDIMFFTLGILLTFSTGIMLYTSLFTGPESAFLLSSPLRDDGIFAYKYFGALALSSWGFLLLGSPVLLAYGLVYKPPHADLRGASWLFFALLPEYFFGFLLIPGAIGGILCLLIVGTFPTKRKQLVYLGIGIVLALGAVVAYRLRNYVHRVPWNPDLLQRLIGQLSFASHPMTPTHWMGRGLRAGARGDVAGALFPLALLWTNGLMSFIAASWLARLIYRRGYNRHATGTELRRRPQARGKHNGVGTGTDARRRHHTAWIDEMLNGALGFLNPQTRLLIVKDFRLFRRDPAQWLQVVILCGLITLYFTNVRRFFVGEIGPEYQSQISLLNLFATSLLVCTFTGRFVYPMLSLEGKRFWILGLLPLPRQRLVWGKFAFSAASTLVVSEFLVLLSDLMLGLPWSAVGIHVLTMACICLGLSGLSVGLGALEPNFRETDPSRIAVGFGGTINLGIGLLYLILILVVMAGPWHLKVRATSAGLVGPSSHFASLVIASGLMIGGIFAAIATLVPMRLGIRALKRMEF